MVSFNFIGNYDMTLEDAEKIIAGRDTATRQGLMLDWLKNNQLSDSVVYDHQYREFENAVGAALVEKRKSELKYLKEPSNESETL